MIRTPERLALSLLLACGTLGACKGPRPDPLPAGKGLVTVDSEPPPGAEVFQAPAWKVGDRFVYQKGGHARLAFRVDKTADGVHHLIDEQGGGLVMLYGEDLSDRGQEKSGSPELTVTNDPADYTLTWPLWVGKRWSCNYVRRAAEEGEVPLLATYECDGFETVKVPAGTFRCLRILRRVRPAAQGNYVERISIAWYAPEVGTIVRRLNDSTFVEALEIDRQ